MKGGFKGTVYYILVGWILVMSGFLPGRVLCVRPGSHVAFEAIDELCCVDHSVGNRRLEIESPDNCTDISLNAYLAPTKEELLLLRADWAAPVVPAEVLSKVDSWTSAREPVRLQPLAFSSRTVVRQC
jgi:hypothetical protein